MFDLPQGYLAQPWAHKEQGFISYEFNRVYDPQGRLDPSQSFWLTTPTQATVGGAPRKISFKEYGGLLGKAALAFGDFSDPGVPPDQVEVWLGKKYKAT